MPNQDVTPAVVRERIRRSFPGRLGVEIVRIDDHEVEGRLEIDERHLHAGGYVHGGVWVAFADAVAAWGTLRHLPPGHDFTTAELKTNVFTAAGPGDVLTAVGRAVHVGKRTQVWEVRTAVGGRDAALFVCTQMILPPR
jgi:1,4-dihydroxy-2-naphthoyl-CoA hydrolase